MPLQSGLSTEHQRDASETENEVLDQKLASDESLREEHPASASNRMNESASVGENDGDQLDGSLEKRREQREKEADIRKVRAAERMSWRTGKQKEVFTAFRKFC